MTPCNEKPRALRCAVYTRKSTEEGLEQEFNTLDAQREAGETFIESQVLSPGVQDGGEAELGAQPLRVGRQ